MATIPARTASGRRCQTAASSATSGGIASASMRLPDRSASSAGAAAAPRSERAGGDESHPCEARTIARMPARIAVGRLDQAAANSASSGAAGAVGSTAGSTCLGSGFSSGKSVSGSGLQIRHRRFDSDRSLSALTPAIPGYARASQGFFVTRRARGRGWGITGKVAVKRRSVPSWAGCLGSTAGSIFDPPGNRSAGLP